MIPNLTQQAFLIWQKAQVVHMSPSFDGYSESSAWVEKLSEHPEEEGYLIDLLNSENQLVVAYALLTLERMKSSQLEKVIGGLCERREKITLLTGSFSNFTDLGGLARRIRKNMTSELLNQVVQVVELLVKGKYAEIETLTKGIRLSSENIRTAIQQYGYTLCYPPPEALRLIDIIQIDAISPPMWSVVAPLWTEEEGRSDLSLELTITKQPSGFKIELDNIHVL